MTSRATIEALERIAISLGRIARLLAAHCPHRWQRLPDNSAVEECAYCALQQPYVEPGFR